MSQTWYTADTPVWFFLNVPGLVHCEYTGLVLFKCPRPVHLGYTSWVHLECSRGFPSQSGVSPLLGGKTPDWEGKPLGHSKRTEPVYSQCTRPGKFKKNQTGVPVVYQAWET